MRLKPRVILLEVIGENLFFLIMISLFIFFLLLFFFETQLILRYLIPSMIFLLILLITIEILKIHGTTYEIAEKGIIIRRVFLSEVQRTIPYSKITNITLQRKPYQLPYSVADILIDTAGTGEIEGVLKNVPYAEAREALFIIEENIKKSRAR